MEKITNSEEKIINSGDIQTEAVSRREFLKSTAITIAGSILIGDFKVVSEAAEQLLSKEREGAPEISFEFYFSPHGTATDLGELPKKIRTADIFIPEMPGWNENLAKELNEISSGKKTPNDFFNEKPNKHKTTFERGLIEAIYNSGVKLEFLDLPANHPLLEDMSMNFWGIFNLDPEKSTKEHLENLKNTARIFAEHQVGREEYILSGLLRLKEKIKNGTLTDFKENKEVKILISIGPLHTSLYHKLSGAKNNTSRSFGQMPYIYNHFAEMSRRYMFGREVDDNLALRALLEISSLTALYRILPSDNTQLKNLYVRKLFNTLEQNEIEKLFRNIIEKGYDTNIVISIIQDSLKNKGIVIPTTEDELKREVKFLSDSRIG